MSFPRKYHYIIDSRDRNTDLFPSPSQYSIDLPEPIINVESVRLLLAEVPFPRYMIHGFNNVLHVSNTSDPSAAVAVELTQGDYDADGMATHLQARLNAVLAPASYTVTYDAVQDKFVVSKSGATAFVVACKGRNASAARILGFASNADYASVAGVVRAPYRRNFVKDNYVILSIENVNNVYGISSVIDRSFGAINSNDSDLNNEYRHELAKQFEPPINSLKKLHISFRDYYGNLYDFQNQDHRLELEFSVWGQGMPRR